MTWISAGGDDLRPSRALVLSLLVHATAVLLPGSWLAGVIGESPEAGPAGTPFEVSLAPFFDEAKGEEVRGVGTIPGRDGRGADPAAPGEAMATGAGPLVPAGAVRNAEGDAGDGRQASSPGSGQASLPGSGQASSPASAGGGTGDAASSAYQPPRLLAGALPIDPKDVESLEVPPEIPVRMRVGTDGRVLEIVPEMPALSLPVLQAIRRSAEAMRFSPARLAGEPVEAWFSMTFVHRR